MQIILLEHFVISNMMNIWETRNGIFSLIHSCRFQGFNGFFKLVKCVKQSKSDQPEDFLSVVNKACIETLRTLLYTDLVRSIFGYDIVGSHRVNFARLAENKESFVKF